MTTPQVRIDQLERATVRLSEQVGGLSSALTAITDIQVRQTVMDERQSDLEATVVPRKEMEATALALSRQLVSYRRLVLRRVYTASIVVVALFAGLGLLAADYLGGKQQANYQVCVDRNQAIVAARDYFVAVQSSSTNPVLQGAAAKALQTYQTADCRRLQ